MIADLRVHPYLISSKFSSGLHRTESVAPIRWLIRDQPVLLGLGRNPFFQSGGPEELDHRDVIHVRFVVGPPIKGIDSLHISKAHSFQHPLHTSRIGGNLSYHSLGPVRKKGDVDIRSMTKLFDELLVLPREAVRVLRAHSSEFFAARFRRKRAPLRQQRR